VADHVKTGESRNPDLLRAEDASPGRRRVGFVIKMDHQLRRIAPVLVGVTLLTILACFVLAYVQFRTSIRAALLLGDPVAVADLPRYTGVVSNIGILLWAGSTTVCLYSGALLWPVREGADRSRYLMFLGLFSALLCLDDLFLLHEELGDGLAILFGMPPSANRALEAWAFLGYLALSAFMVLRYWPTIRRTDFLLLVAAGGCLAVSASIDVSHALFPSLFSGPFVDDVAKAAEDVAKLSGILLWCAYAVRASATGVRDALR
jgi:hypothetical protein